jgi:hypothetical protein
MKCKLFRNGMPSVDIVIEFEDETVTRDRSGAFLIGSVNGWLPTDQFELQPSGGSRIPIVVTKNLPSSKGVLVVFCSLLDKWE